MQSGVPDIQVLGAYGQGKTMMSFDDQMTAILNELAAFRILAPYFGMSSYVTGIIINVILLALAAGYVLGGQVADRHRSWKLPYLAVLLSASYLLLVYLFYGPLLQFFSIRSAIIGTAFTVLLMFFVPMVLLAFLPPYLIRLISTERAVGRS